MQMISAKELERRKGSERVAVFDVRGDVLFEQGHIPDANTAPMGSLNFRIVRVMNPDSCIVLYSENGEDDLAKQSAERIEALGMTNVHVLEGGLEAWRAEGLEVVPSVSAKTHTHGPVLEVRPVVVDREKAYGGAFSEPPAADTGGAGG